MNEKQPNPRPFENTTEGHQETGNLDKLREQRSRLMAEFETSGREILEKAGAKYYVIFCKGGYYDQPGYNNVEKTSGEDNINKQKLQVLVYDKAIPEWSWNYRGSHKDPQSHEYKDTDESNLPAAEIGTVSPTLTEATGVYLNSEGTEVVISTEHTEDAGGPYPTHIGKTRARILDGKINNADFAEDNVGLFATQEEAQAWAKTKMEEAARALEIEYGRGEWEKKQKEEKAEEKEKWKRRKKEAQKRGDKWPPEPGNEYYHDYQDYLKNIKDED